jgi:hypothetical protein
MEPATRCARDRAGAGAAAVTETSGPGEDEMDDLIAALDRASRAVADADLRNDSS